MRGFFSICSCLLPLIRAFPAGGPSLSLFQKRYDDYSASRSVVYVQTFHYVNGSNLSLMPLSDPGTRASHIYLASVHINDPPGTIALNDNAINDTYWDNVWSEAAQLQQDGVKVMMMLGGAARGSYARLCSGDGEGNDGVIINEEYYIPLRDTLKYHKVDGLDLDIEERLDISCPLTLLQRFNQDFGPHFILTMAPVASDMDARERGLGGFSYSRLDLEATSPDKPQLINWFNVQFYNGFGDASSPKGYNAIIQNGYTSERIVMGVLANKGDGGSGWYNISTYQNTISTLRANYPDFGGSAAWEYWDAGEADNINNPVEWISDMSDADFGVVAAKSDYSYAPLSEGQSPWPNMTQALQELNVSHIEAVQALNVSSGNLDDALKLLGLAK